MSTAPKPASEAQRILQRILDEQGYIVIWGNFACKKGDVIRIPLQSLNEGVVHHEGVVVIVVVIGESNVEEYIRQSLEFFDYEPHTPGAPFVHFYRVNAE